MHILNFFDKYVAAGLRPIAVYCDTNKPIIAGWNEGEGGRFSLKTFYILILVLETMMIGVFAATDVFLFYIFFEAMLVPVYFLIGGFGSGARQAAAVKFLLYSLFGGLLMLASIIGLYVISSNQKIGRAHV